MAKKGLTMAEESVPDLIIQRCHDAGDGWIQILRTYQNQ